MSTKTIRPGIAAAVAAGRALLAAGWHYDSTTPMADDTTIRTLLHPSGREITARTVNGGEQTDLTMTGLTLEQVAGAITGAGLTAGPEPEHGHASMTAGGPGENEAECLCGVTYAGFDTTREASELLDRHIAKATGKPAEERPVCAATAVGVHCSPACYRSRGKDCDTPLAAKSEPTPRQRLADELHHLAEAIATTDLPIGPFARLGLGVVDSRADLDRWATHLGTTIDGPDCTGIPSVTARIPLSGDRFGPELTVHVQSPKEEVSELERLRAENARLKAAAERVIAAGHLGHDDVDDPELIQADAHAALVKALGEDGAR